MIVNILKILLRPRYNDLTIQYSGIKLSFFEGSNKITRFFDRITEKMMIIFRISVISMLRSMDYSPQVVLTAGYGSSKDISVYSRSKQNLHHFLQCI